MQGGQQNKYIFQSLTGVSVTFKRGTIKIQKVHQLIEVTIGEITLFWHIWLFPLNRDTRKQLKSRSNSRVLLSLLVAKFN